MAYNKGPTERTMRVIKMHMDGASNREIAEALGMNYSTVSTLIHINRKAGRLPTREQEYSDHPVAVLKRNGLRFGSMVRLFNDLLPEQQRWLMDQCIKYKVEALDEMIVEIVRDFYEETRDVE